MLNSTKTWQERFDKKFIDSETSDIDGKTDYYLNDKANEVLPLKQFISDIRKRDMEALIKKFDDDVRYTSRLIKILIKKHYDLPKM